MILNTGCRTDIPAFFSEWFYNRVREGDIIKEAKQESYFDAQLRLF
ncbi:DUF1848 family protein [Fusicatenibacter sp.]